MTFSIAEMVWLATVTVWNRNTLAEETLYFSSSNDFTGGGGLFTESNRRLLVPVLASRTAYNDHTTRGAGRVTVGSVVISNQDALLDYLRTYGFDGRAIVLYLGQTGAAWPTDFAALEATMESGLVGQEDLTIKLRDWQRSAAVPLQTTVYAGDNVLPDGIEGTEDLKGKPLPFVRGVVFNAEPDCVNPIKQIYRYGDGSTSAIPTDVRDRGISLTYGISAWNAVTSQFGATAINGADVNGLNVVLVGDSGKISYSTNGGSSFTSVTPPTGSNFYAVKWFAAANLWIAVGASGVCYTSPDMINWTSRTSNFGATTIRCVACSDTKAVLGGDAGKISTSTNGTAYAAQSAIFGAVPVYGMKYAAGYFAAVGSLSSVGRSTDGATWTDQVSLDPAANHLRAVTHDGLQFVAVGDTGSIFVSSDAKTWSTRALRGVAESAFGQANLIAVEYGNGRRVAVSDAGLLGFSTDADGAVWTLKDAGFASSSINTIVFASAVPIWVTAGASGKSFRSTATGTYASLADLEDDSLQPDEGTYKYYAAGNLFRISIPPTGAIRCDITEGSSHAFRVPSNIFVNVLQRAGFSIPANTVASPSALATAPWGGSGASATNAVGTYAGKSFSRINAANTGARTQTVTIAADGTEWLTYYIKANGVAGTAQQFLFDATASVSRGRIEVTIAADGTITAAALNGKRARFARMPGGEGVYGISVKCPGVIAANTNIVFVCNSGTATSFLITEVTLQPSEPDWSVFDITKLEIQNDEELGYFTKKPDVKCSEALDEIAQSIGAGWWTDAAGVIRIQRLEDPAPNLVPKPSTLADADWVKSDATTATNAVGVYAGKSFSRISNANNDAIYTLVTLAENGTYYLTIYVKSNGVAGTTSLLLYDQSAVTARIQGTLTISTAGVASVTMVTGSHVRTALLPGDEGVYGITMKGTGVIAANTNHVYASNGGTLTSLLVSEVTLLEGEPIATINQSPEMDGMAPVQSADENGGLPSSRTVVRYSKNYAPLAGNELSAGVGDLNRSLFGKEWLDAGTDLDTDVTDAHPLATSRTVETLLVDDADAQDEAEREQELYGVDRSWFDVPCFMSATLMAVELGDVVELASSRFGMGAGRRVRVLGIKPDAAQGRITFQVWT